MSRGFRITRLTIAANRLLGDGDWDFVLPISEVLENGCAVSLPWPFCYYETGTTVPFFVAKRLD
jgi:hypothetical protein